MHFGCEVSLYYYKGGRHLPRRKPLCPKFFGYQRVATVLIAAFAPVWGCKTAADAAPPVIESIYPAEKPYDMQITLAVSGQNFYERVQRNTKGADELSNVGSFAIRLYSDDRTDDDSYLLSDILRTDDHSLEGTVGNNIMSGRYSVEVETPFGLTSSLPGAFLVTNGGAQDTASEADVDTDTDSDSHVDTDTDSDTEVVDTSLDIQDSMNIILNTSSSGAGVLEAVYDFPVLIRLDDTNFNFGAGRTADEACFYDSAGDLLSHEIEQWDTATPRADIWVKVPVILADNDEQFITMRWNADRNESVSSSTAVFETDNSFAGVYHLNATQSFGSYLLPDATQADVDGTGISFTRNNVDDGISGEGVSLSGSSYINVDTLYGSPESATLSGWVSLSADQGQLISLGSHLLIGFVELSSEVVGSYYPYNSTSGNDTATYQSLANTGWHHIAYTVDSLDNRQQLFIDGVVVAENRYFSDINYAYPSRTTAVGAAWDGQSDFLYGLVDEVRIETEPRSESWIKLCYENQRPDGQTLAEFP